MSEPTKPQVGTVGWMDLTVENAQDVRDFYGEVVGWSASDVDMGGYSDFCMNTPGSGTTVAGICHARGTNAGLPAQWLMYITVEDLDASVARVEALGGKVIAGPRDMGAQGRYCIIEDPAGAVAALYAPA
jgi:predicted enzyme related to lactoylglutathione lyase